jgi:hypothetical protein
MPRTAEPRILPAVRDEVAGGIRPSWAARSKPARAVLAAALVVTPSAASALLVEEIKPVGRGGGLRRFNGVSAPRGPSGVSKPFASVSSQTLSATSYSAGATKVQYTVGFIATGRLTGGSSTITVAAPVGTVFTSSLHTCNVYYDHDDLSGAGSNCNTVPVENGGATLPLTPNSSIGGGDHVTLTLAGITNTTKAGPLTEPARPRGGHS